MDSVRTEIPLWELPIDRQDLLRRCLGRMDIAERVIRKLQVALGDDLAQLELSLLACDAEGIARVAHRIKGASLSTAASDLAAAASGTEAAARGGCWSDIRVWMHRLVGECTRFGVSRRTFPTDAAAPALHAGTGLEAEECAY